MPETQAFSIKQATWSPPTGTLGELVTASLVRAERQVGKAEFWKTQALAVSPTLSFRAALLRSTVGLVAEIKRRSPSRGVIRDTIDAADRARMYAGAGAAAISVLTEPDRFGGSVDDLDQVASAVQVPVLRKDFIVAPVQLYHARALGASAALLIARALSPDRLRTLHDAASAIGLEILVEVRNEAELELALEIGASVVGVNNRNLETLVIESGTAERIVPLIPRGVVAVAESGMSSRDHVLEAAAFGADAVLVGSAVSEAEDAPRLVRELTGVRVERDARPD